MKAFQKHSQKNALRLLTEKEESKQTENTSKVDAISKRNKPFLRSFEDVLTPPERNERLDTKSSTPHHQTMSSNKPQTSKIKETRSESSSSQSSDKESEHAKIQKLKKKENKNFIKQLQQRK